MSAAKESLVDAMALVGECRKLNLFAMMSDVKEDAILRDLLDKLNDLEERVEAIGDEVAKSSVAGDMKCVRRGYD